MTKLNQKAEMMRLQKFLSQAGIASRRKAEELILAGKVTINGVVAELGAKVQPQKDKVLVAGKLVTNQVYKLYAFHKPTKVITTMYDSRHRPAVGNYVSKLPVKVFPIGRLDFDAAGLLLLTNDGDYANKLLHPRYQIQRSYWVVLDGFIDNQQIELLLRGVQLDDGWGKADFLKRVQPKSIAKYFKPFPAACAVVNIIVSEGRNHFVKRLFAQIGLKVTQLFRYSYGKHKIGNLRPGEIKEIRF
ncbi:MAG: rRNA pseudouridine synthase [Deltaproteobacteria bacterium]|jgi:pseudouridine synthase|nr:rRNA pseudouridine synthase [Deltaproteobacteria bacterium]